MAGKTGTAQVVGLNISSGKTGPWKYRDHGLFIFFAPFDNPRYAGAVIIEHGGGSGSAYPIARDVTTFLFDRCPKISHHNLAMIRGDRKNPSLEGPKLEEYQQLYEYIRKLWAPREEDRYGSLVEPMLQWAKVQTAREQRQVVPCRAGILSGVIYANGDVSMCEQHEPLGNLRTKSFNEIWYGDEARQLRGSIRAKECHCTNEIFMWPSVTYQPLQLAKAMVCSRPWRKPDPLTDEERVDWTGSTANVPVPSPVVASDK